MIKLPPLQSIVPDHANHATQNKRNMPVKLPSLSVGFDPENNDGKYGANPISYPKTSTTRRRYSRAGITDPSAYSISDPNSSINQPSLTEFRRHSGFQANPHVFVSPHVKIPSPHHNHVSIAAQDRSKGTGHYLSASPPSFIHSNLDNSVRLNQQWLSTGAEESQSDQSRDSWGLSSCASISTTADTSIFTRDTDVDDHNAWSESPPPSTRSSFSMPNAVEEGCFSPKKRLSESVDAVDFSVQSLHVNCTLQSPYLGANNQFDRFFTSERRSPSDEMEIGVSRQEDTLYGRLGQGQHLPSSESDSQIPPNTIPCHQRKALAGSFPSTRATYSESSPGLGDQMPLLPTDTGYGLAFEYEPRPARDSNSGPTYSQGQYFQTRHQSLPHCKQPRLSNGSQFPQTYGLTTLPPNDPRRFSTATSSSLPYPAFHPGALLPGDSPQKFPPQARAKFRRRRANTTSSNIDSADGNTSIPKNPEKPHVCSYCQTAFRRRHDMERHERTLHTGEEPYLCDGCGKAFARSDARKRHQMNGAKGRIGGCHGPVWSHQSSGHGDDPRLKRARRFEYSHWI